MKDEQIMQYLTNKKIKVLENIQDLCSLFEIEAEYLIQTSAPEEVLKLSSKLNDMPCYIHCTGNSIMATVDELIAYIFLNTYARDRGVSPYSSVVKQIKSCRLSQENIARLKK